MREVLAAALCTAGLAVLCAALLGSLWGLAIERKWLLCFFGARSLGSFALDTVWGIHAGLYLGLALGAIGGSVAIWRRR